MKRRRKRPCCRGRHEITYLCAAVLACTLIYIGGYYGRQLEADRQYAQMQEIPVVPVVRNIRDLLPKAGIEVPAEEALTEEQRRLRKTNTINFEELWRINEDIYAWIEVPGTLVDYPVLQHPEDDSYYLNHTAEHGAGLPGSIYSESVHPKDFSALHTVLYGHNMKNDSMFGSLHSYEDAAFLEENPYIYIYLPDRTLLYEIFAAARFSDAYLPLYCDYEDEKAFLSYIEEIRTCSFCQNAELEVRPRDRILTLSTCMANDAGHRFLVEAVLIDEYDR